MSPFIKNPISHQPAFNLCPNAMQLHWNNSFPTSGNGCLFSAPCTSIDALVLGFSFFPPLPGDLSPIVGRTSGWHGRNWPHYSTYHLNKKCGGCFAAVFFPATLANIATGIVIAQLSKFINLETTKLVKICEHEPRVRW